ncbi:MAG: BON domain-containing protein [Catalinimonas sp.]
MGLFSFIKDAGEKIFGDKEKEEAKAKLNTSANVSINEDAVRAQVAADYLRRLNLDIDNLRVNVSGSRATLSGAAKDQATRERAVLAVGNSEGIAEVDDNLSVQAPEEPEATFYTVESGDSLSKIAKAHYGNANA